MIILYYHYNYINIDTTIIPYYPIHEKNKDIVLVAQTFANFEKRLHFSQSSQKGYKLA